MKKKIFYVLVLLLLVVANDAALAKEAGYFIGPGDTLEISVWKDESLSRQVIVPPDGVISFPLIGDIDVTNLTVKDLREVVKRKLSEYVPDATVTVIILQFNSLRAYVIGKVNKPGEFPITMETNVMQILSMAGGLNPFASKNKIVILRRKNTETVKIPFNYKDVLKGENLEQNILLQRGDVVVVP
jgi:polysaccharide export outer membrane protein